ncbi:hypothetical protein E3T28_08935 [Cryobacterium sinapicolor]|uniref:Oligosaccharide repeat unit polymerase n=1 Tax=Cryobacterium sinapicolor TaxID=1259236 RepID=A0ABY2J5K2_9MICO|nr:MULTISPECIES: hypothetical protein [Cryobacterium]TFC83435.1 hypothetical protein E3O67_15025 [Cryobacterium sp. TMT3-29-2]TFC99657.1 hypothetical protein E3T28_08935 [Cryobacterium sinapicolor]
MPDVGRGQAWILTLVLVVWAGLRLALLIVVGRPMLFDFFFWMFVYVFMGIAPTVQIRSGLISRTTQGIDESLELPTAALVCLGVACYEIGRLVAYGHERGRLTTGSREEGNAPVRAVTQVRTWSTLVLVGAGFIFSLYFISKIGLGSLFGSRDQAFAARSATWTDPAVRSIMYAVAIYPLLVGIGALVQVRRRTTGPLAMAYGGVIAIGIALLLTVVNPVSSARYSLGTVLFALAVYAGALLTVARVRTALTAALVGLIFLFPLADAFRRPEVNLVRNGFFGEYEGNPDYDAFWQVANAFSYGLDGLIEPGRQALGSVLFWVPRGLWPDKPVDTGILLAQYRGYSFQNLSAPLWAEFLVNGGIGVLIVGFLLVGYALRVMDSRLLPAVKASGYWAIVGAVFPVYMTILLRGSLLQATGVVAVALACLLFVRQPVRSPGGDSLSGTNWPEFQQSPASRTGSG